MRRPKQPWGGDIPTDVDSIAHWITDIDRTIDTLQGLRSILQSILITMANGEDSSELLKYADKLATRATSKSSGIYQGIALRARK